MISIRNCNFSITARLLSLFDHNEAIEEQLIKQRMKIVGLWKFKTDVSFGASNELIWYHLEYLPTEERIVIGNHAEIEMKLDVD